MCNPVLHCIVCNVSQSLSDYTIEHGEEGVYFFILEISAIFRVEFCVDKLLNMFFYILRVISVENVDLFESFFIIAQDDFQNGRRKLLLAI